jgi:hypothetical protein
MAPGFLPEVEYPKKPFGMFFVIGAFFVIRLGLVPKLGSGRKRL